MRRAETAQTGGTEMQVQAGRQSAIDNIRSLMIFLVIVMHAAVTYSHFGSWYYSADPAITPPLLYVFGFFQAHLQAFFMGLLFLIAGYYAPTSLERHGSLQFAGRRFMRLALPTLFYIFLIHDTVGHFLLKWHGDAPFWPSYVYYVTHGDWMDGTGPMWFAAALLLFSWVYALIRLALPHITITHIPTTLSIVMAAILIGLVSFAVRQYWPVGSSWHNMQFGYFTQYIFFFAFGILARRGDWITRFPKQRGYVLLCSAVIFTIIVWPALMAMGDAAHNMAFYDGGMHWQALTSAVWEQIFGLCFSVGLIVLFREKFNGTGRFATLCRKNSFAVYVWHMPVVVILSLLLVSATLPPGLKFVITSLAGFVITLALTHLVIRRIPLLNRIF